MSVSVIIPVSALVMKAVPKRLEALQWAIKDLYQGVEVIVVEQSLDGKFYFLPHLKGVRCVKLNYPVFNKGWCLNVGAKHAKNDYLVFADADMYVKQSYLKQFKEWMSVSGRLWAFAWNRLIYTNCQQRYVAINNNGGLHGVKHETPRRGLSEGGLVGFYKPFFNGIGQYNECIKELGGPDSEIIIRAYNKTKTYYMYNQTVYHLWHPQIPKRTRPTRAQNIKIIHKLKKNVFRGIEWLSEQKQGDESGPLGKEFLG